MQQLCVSRPCLLMNVLKISFLFLFCFYRIVQFAKLSEAFQVINSLHKKPLYNLNVTLADISNPKLVTI